VFKLAQLIHNLSNWKYNTI